MDWITPIKLSGGQEKKLEAMVLALVPNLIGYHYENEYLSLYVDKSDAHYEFIHWLEFCFTFLAPKIAAQYVRHHISTTPQWAEYMVLQKIAHEIHKVNPIDILHDIWINPGEYKQSL
jgi:hypothetical protein